MSQVPELVALIDRAKAAITAKTGKDATDRHVGILCGGRRPEAVSRWRTSMPIAIRKKLEKIATGDFDVSVLALAVDAKEEDAEPAIGRAGGSQLNGQLAASTVGEFNGFLLPPNFDRFAPDAQAKLIDAIQERWRNEFRLERSRSPSSQRTKPSERHG